MSNFNRLFYINLLRVNLKQIYPLQRIYIVGGE